jgi:hypothetical protein
MSGGRLRGGPFIQNSAFAQAVKGTIHGITENKSYPAPILATRRPSLAVRQSGTFQNGIPALWSGPVTESLN